MVREVNMSQLLKYFKSLYYRGGGGVKVEVACVLAAFQKYKK